MRYLFVSYIEDAYPGDMDGVAVATAIVLTCFAPMLRFRLQSFVMDHACYSYYLTTTAIYSLSCWGESSCRGASGYFQITDLALEQKEKTVKRKKKLRSQGFHY